MAKRMQTWVLVFLALASGFGLPAFGGFDEPAKVLFLDSFESLKTEKGALYTQPSVGGPIAGAISGTAKLAEGKKGHALELSGASNVLYQDFSAINLLGGEVSFWVKLDFDPHARAEQAGGITGQFYLTIEAADGSRFFLYSQLYTSYTDVSFQIQNPTKEMLLNAGVPFVWKEGVWHQIKVAWGNALEIWVDGEKRSSTPWEGLFGTIPIEQEKMRLYVGMPDPSNIHSDFTMDELTVLGPRPGNLAARPRMSVPLLEGAPALDGKLDDPFWQKAGKATGFVGAFRRELVPDQPSFLAAYTTEGLCVGARIPMSSGQQPKAAGGSAEDAFEVFLQPSPSSPAFCRFAANAAGTELASKPEWKVATSSKAGEWTATAFIPFKSLGLAVPPKAGDVWGANFIADSAAGPGAARTWAFTGGHSDQPMTFGELLFTGQARALREDSFTGFSDGNPTVRLDRVGAFEPVITVTTKIFDNQGKPVSDQTYRMSDAPSAVIGAQYLQTGAYTARISAVDEAKTEFFRQNVLFRIAKAFTLGVKNYPYAGVAEATASMGALEGKAAEVSFKILSPKGQALASQSVKRFAHGAATAKLATADLDPGDYSIEASASNAQGKPLGSVQQGLKIYSKPAWWKNDLGMDHSVPPPWTPVKATEKGFGVWGRDYQFGDSVFPRQILSQGKPLFSGTPRVILRAGGKETDLVAATCPSPNTKFPDQVELAATAEVGGVSARLKGTLEFDGCYRFDLKLTPNGAKSVEGLVFELPISKEIAQFLLSGNGPSATIDALKPNYKSAYTPNLWLGNDDMGLAVFTDSDQYWRPRADAGAIQIIGSQDAALLRLTVVGAPLALNGPISYRFGLMASPVRPIVDGDPFVLGFSYSDPDEVVFPEFLSYPAQGVTTPQEGTLEFWARRTKAGADTVELFNLGEAREGVPYPQGTPAIIRCNVGSDIYVDVDQIRLLTATKINLSSEEFSHVALTWDAKTVSLYVNGRRAATAEPTEAFRKCLENAVSHEGDLRFGCRDESRGFTAVEVDEIHVSAKARYQGESFAPPTGPFQKDADTRLLDPLDETFVPDGQDALTVAGGQASLGCRFVAGKFGRALRIEVAPPHPDAELIKASNSYMMHFWNWVYGTGVEGGQETYWPPMMFGPVSPDFQKAIALAHRRGLKIIQYTGYPAIGAPSPLADQFANEWEVIPVGILPYTPPEGHYMINTSLSARGYADYMAAGTERLMNLGSDGILNDGFTRIWSSENLYARSGYVDEDGVVRPAVPIFAWREGMKRLYRVVHAHEPDGIVCNHSSFDMMLPALSFSDIYYTGEHENYENLLNARLRFTSKPWGLQAGLVGASQHMYSSVHTAVQLLIGTGLYGYNLQGRYGLGRKWMNFRKAYLAFGYQSAQWVPFSKNRDRFYTTDEPKTEVSLYYHPGKDAFLIVANMDAQPRTVAVQLKLKAFGLEGASLRARNALTQVPVALAQDGKLNVFVRAKSFVLVSVEPNP